MGAKIPEHIKSGLHYRRGVSPVIGVILMVAVTVIVAAVIGASAMGMSDHVAEVPPQAQLSIDQGEYTFSEGADLAGTTVPVVNITHESGEAISPDNIEVTVDGEPAYAISSPDDADFPLYNYPVNGGHSLVIHPFDQAAVGGQSISSGTSTRVLMRTNYINERPQEIGGAERIQYYKADSQNPEGMIYFQGGSPKYINDPSLNDLILQEGQTLRIIWTGGSSDSTTLLHEYEIQ